MPGRGIRTASAGVLLAGTLLAGASTAADPTAGSVTPAIGLLAATNPMAAGNPPTGLFAAPACGSLPPPATVVTGIPWAQRRYAPDRLKPLVTGSGIVVAVIDSGVDGGHPQLKGRVLDGADFLDRGGDGTRDCVGHGTAVASIIAANEQKGVVFRGLAPKAKILPVRVSEQQIVDGKESGRTVTAGQFAQAIRWAVDHGADVLNLSVVLYEDHPAVREAVEYAVAKDVVVVAAAGNLHENGDPRPYPASYDGVLGVGAIGADGSRSPFSQVGSYVDVVAPGGAVLTAMVGRGHKEQSGTSYAAPFAAATAALVREYQPKLSASEVIDRIVATADPAPGSARSAAYGSGVLNPYRAVTDTLAAGGAPTPAELAEESADSAAVAQAERRSHSRAVSLELAVVGGAVAGVAVLLAVVLPRGARRGWRPADPV